MASTVYTVVLCARSAATIPAAVAPAAEEAGLPASSVASFIDGFTTGSFSNVTGLTDDILAAGTKAYFDGNFRAYRTVYLATLHQGQNEDVLAGEKREKR